MDIVQIFTDSPLRNFTYLILDPNKKKAIVVDPHYPHQVIDWATSNQYSLHSIINTHEHNDHICGNEELSKFIETNVCCHPNSRNKILTSTRSLDLGSRMDWGKGWIEILDTPGHTMSHISLLVGYNDSAEFILTGDTLFNAGVGNCKNGGNIDILYNTFKNQLEALPDHIKLFPGHDYWENNLNFTLSIDPENSQATQLLQYYKKELQQGRFLVSTLGLEREVSLFFRTKFQSNWKGNNWISPSPEYRSWDNSKSFDESIFKKLRSLRDSW